MVVHGVRADPQQLRDVVGGVAGGHQRQDGHLPVGQGTPVARRRAGRPPLAGPDPHHPGHLVQARGAGDQCGQAVPHRLGVDLRRHGCEDHDDVEHRVRLTQAGQRLHGRRLQRVDLDQGHLRARQVAQLAQMLQGGDVPQDDEAGLAGEVGGESLARQPTLAQDHEVDEWLGTIAHRQPFRRAEPAPHD